LACTRTGRSRSSGSATASSRDGRRCSFIETSSITLPADEVFGRCFVDVFSCRPFDPEVAAAIAVEHFGGTATVTVLER
jgi:hypothetical protein